MQRNPDIKNDNTLTSAFRSKIKLERKFIGKFYRNNWVHSPGKTQLVLLLVIWMIGILPFVLDTNFFKTPLTSKDSFLYLLIVCSTITMANTFNAYVRHRRK